ncbi:hypothetical protein KIK84_10335 [Curvibacter sp. CHRR-16]|uniref:pilus assembly protein TadG-related protein n=1 Tax=Curvibacter sp. CHRR-16 TaxID=2835872 RepID=UPI001BDA090B|nr:pilus assembly protein TadG-related protein [Curvibacter sp. CHRR-16]MBT0570728.1 hypothetical protein [Curvibacter sp. CHRR-16]
MMPTLVQRCRQTGAIAVEAALGLPLLLAIGLVGTDMHRIGLERTQIEQAAGSAAITVAAQSKLTKAGLSGVVDVLTMGRPQDYQVVVLNVLQTGQVNWGFQRGQAGQLCAPLSDGRDYQGDLPEKPPEDDGDSTLSMVVVLVCRSSEDITLSGGLVLPGVLGARVIHRAVAQSIELDEALTSESQANGLSSMKSSS